MAYSMKRLPDDESQFPQPPRWLLWFSDRERNGNAKDVGQIRHLESLQKCKKSVSPYGGGNFYYDWTIYEWDEAATKYQKRYSGKAGQSKDANPLFRKRVNPKKEKVREVAPDDLEAAMRSIREAVAS